MNTEFSQPENDSLREKAFVLAQPKSPEELAREATRKTMPSARRQVYGQRLLAQAKWLFGAITDDTFLFDFGGDGFGTLVTTIKDLSERYRHDRDSISKWLAILEAREAVWIEWQHPFCVIHVSAAVPLPRHKATLVQKIRARAGAARFSRAEVVGMPFFSAQEGQPASKAQENRIIGGNVPASHAEDVGTTCGRYPHIMRKVSVESDRQLPQTPPKTPPRRAEGVGTSCGNLPYVKRKVSVSDPVQPPANTGGKPLLEKVSVERGCRDGDGGESPPPEDKGRDGISRDGDALVEFELWCQSWEGAYRSKLEREAARIRAKNAAAPGEFWAKRLAFLLEKLDGGKPPAAAKPAKPAAKAAKPAAMPLEKRRELLARARKEAGV